MRYEFADDGRPCYSLSKYLSTESPISSSRAIAERSMVRLSHRRERPRTSIWPTLLNLAGGDWRHSIPGSIYAAVDVIPEIAVA